jgi:hypothetical protein
LRSAALALAVHQNCLDFLAAWVIYFSPPRLLYLIGKHHELNFTNTLRKVFYSPWHLTELFSSFHDHLVPTSWSSLWPYELWLLSCSNGKTDNRWSINNYGWEDCFGGGSVCVLLFWFWFLSISAMRLKTFLQTHILIYSRK